VSVSEDVDEPVISVICHCVWLYVPCLVICTLSGYMCRVWLYVPCLVVCTMSGYMCRV